MIKNFSNKIKHRRPIQELKSSVLFLNLPHLNLIDKKLKYK